jgi:DNA-binding transcriptional LysR family regulator
MPQSIADLEQHNRLGFSYSRAVEGWPLLDGDTMVDMPVNGNLRISDGESLRQAALTGLGLARLAAFQVQADIAAGRLLPVLETANPGDREEIHALFLGRSGPLPARVRVLLDYLAKHVRIA